MAELGTLSRRLLARQALRFLVVGILNTTVTLGTVFLLHEVARVSIAVSSASGFVVGMIQGFVLNRFWTFAGVAHAVPVTVQVTSFAAINVLSGGIFTAINVVLSRSLPLLLSSILAAGVIMPLSFALNRWGVFRERRA